MEKKTARSWVDAGLGVLGVIGLLVECARRNTNEINWTAFLRGFLGPRVVSFILAAIVG